MEYFNEAPREWAYLQQREEGELGEQPPRGREIEVLEGGEEAKKKVKTEKGQNCTDVRLTKRK